MTALEGFPLPQTAAHDEHGNHIPPHIPEWRRNAGAGRTVKGSEVERDQKQKAQFEAHLDEHRRRGEAASIAGECDIFGCFKEPTHEIDATMSRGRGKFRVCEPHSHSQEHAVHSARPLS